VITRVLAVATDGLLPADEVRDQLFLILSGEAEEDMPWEILPNCRHRHRKRPGGLGKVAPG